MPSNRLSSPGDEFDGTGLFVVECAPGAGGDSRDCRCRQSAESVVNLKVLRHHSARSEFHGLMAEGAAAVGKRSKLQVRS